MYAIVSIQGQKWQLYSETTIWERTVLILFRGKKERKLRKPVFFLLLE